MADPRCVLLDLDGVIWLADEPIPGAADAVARLGDLGVRVAYFTNNSFPLLAQHLDKLHRFGLEPAAEDVLTSPQAAARCCMPGERALVLGGAGILEALAARGVEAQGVSDDMAANGADAPHVDVVVCGIDPGLTYQRLAVATGALRRGARFVATNDDATFPRPDGVVPGAGAIVAALATASARQPIIAGKPNAPAAELAVERLGRIDLVVGDRASTDGALALRLGVPFALVLSGVTPPAHGPLEVEPAIEAADLAALSEELGQRWR